MGVSMIYCKQSMFNFIFAEPCCSGDGGHEREFKDFWSWRCFVALFIFTWQTWEKYRGWATNCLSLFKESFYPDACSLSVLAPAVYMLLKRVSVFVYPLESETFWLIDITGRQVSELSRTTQRSSVLDSCYCVSKRPGFQLWAADSRQHTWRMITPTEHKREGRVLPRDGLPLATFQTPIQP